MSSSRRAGYPQPRGRRGAEPTANDATLEHSRWIGAPPGQFGDRDRHVVARPSPKRFAARFRRPPALMVASAPCPCTSPSSRSPRWRRTTRLRQRRRPTSRRSSPAWPLAGSAASPARASRPSTPASCACSPPARTAPRSSPSSWRPLPRGPRRSASSPSISWRTSTPPRRSPSREGSAPRIARSTCAGPRSWRSAAAPATRRSTCSTRRSRTAIWRPSPASPWRASTTRAPPRGRSRSSRRSCSRSASSSSPRPPPRRRRPPTTSSRRPSRTRCISCPPSSICSPAARTSSIPWRRCSESSVITGSRTCGRPPRWPCSRTATSVRSTSSRPPSSTAIMTSGTALFRASSRATWSTPSTASAASSIPPR